MFKMASTLTKTVEIFVDSANTSPSVTLSSSGFGSSLKLIFVGVTCELTLTIKVTLEMVIKKMTITKKQFEREQQTIISFDKL